MKSCAVFCGSRMGNDPIFKDAAKDVGRIIADLNITLIYGGGNVGLMGETATACLRNNGVVKGIIPNFLNARETFHEDVNDLEITEDMPSRKVKLFTLADAYIILPGGMGTLDEFSEVMVNSQLNIMKKPICIFNIQGWANHLISFIDDMVKIGFADESLYKLFTIAHEKKDIISFLKKY